MRSLDKVIYILELLIENQEEIIEELKGHRIQVPQKPIPLERIFGEIRP